MIYDLVVIGAGVAGLMAAGSAAERGASVLLLEKMERPARKLRITGKGRCNITNTRPFDEFVAKIHSGADFVDKALRDFDNVATVEFFNSIGLSTVEERGGRIFPTSGVAGDVAAALERWVTKSGVEVRCNSDVQSISVTEDRVDGVVLKNGDKIECHIVIVATGGVSYPRTGSTGDGHQMAFDTGHNIMPLRPALVPLSIADDIRQFSGLELRNVKAKLVVDNEVVDERFGDVDFTDVAISGATVLQLSRAAVEAIIEGCRVAIELDLKSALNRSKLLSRIDRDIEALPAAPLRVVLDRLTPRALHQKIARQAQLKTDVVASRLSAQDRARLAGVLKGLRFEVADYRGFGEAIITVGGVDLADVDFATMQSLKVNNLYFAGELLDIDADTGGFNIQLALSTARLAANSIHSFRSAGTPPVQTEN